MPILAYMVVPWFALAVGGLIALRRAPGDTFAAAVQHLAAGVVFAAAATEVLPDLTHQGSTAAILIGGGLGLGAMFAIKQIGKSLEGNWSLIILIAIDILIDGLVLGIGFAAGARQGLLLLAALTLEIFFLGLTVAEELKATLKSSVKVFAGLALCGALIPLGALLGTPVHTLPPFYQGIAFAFALISLLYLVTEELLVEAHEKPDSPWITSMFFIGFLGLLALETAVPA